MKPSDIYHKSLSMALVEATLDNDDERQERRATIANIPRLSRRLGATALHRAVHFVGAERVREIYELPYRCSGIKVLGYGSSATAIQNGDEDTVHKIIRGTNRLSDAERLELARRLEDRIAINEAFHPDIAVPTIVSIEPSPVLNNPTVQLIQPFVRATTEHPDPQEVIHFAEKSLEEMMPTGYLPDVQGKQNVLNTEAGIRLIDTVPISIENAGTFGLCAMKLYAMANAGKKRVFYSSVQHNEMIK